MTTQIDVETLRQWLEEHRAATVVDVRTSADREQWSIPGSIHVDAYDALHDGRAGALATVALPAGEPIVTVCGAGRLSRTAADVLSGRGFDARSLTGGMKAWSLAWNTADATMPRTHTRVLQVRRTGKGCLSYIVSSGDEAAVIDPSVPSRVYLDLARARHWRIRYVIDTHIHADHLSRARQLATDSSAELRLPKQARTHFPYAPIADGDRIAVGSAVITAHRTPGHTLESTSYVLNDEAVFTGDTLFTHGVGRPDLHAAADAARERARALFRSLGWLRSLPPPTVVLPGHTSEPVAFDGQPVLTTIGDVEGWLAAWLVVEEVFVDRVVSRLPPNPPNFERIVEFNETGAFPSGDVTDLEAGANRCAVAAA
jgi:glyoxylase-like metal-dependent hydrolase (beta-lactamase superfamily II)/rhodanese-related sulfurtransferase